MLDGDFAGFGVWKSPSGGKASLCRYKTFPNETYYVYGRENPKQMFQDMLEFFDTYLKDNVSGTAGPPNAGSSDR